MATLNFFRPFKTNLIDGVFDFTDDTTCTLTVALSNSAPVATNEDLADISEISYTNSSARVIQNVAQSEASGTISVAADNLTITATGGSLGPLRYAVIYDDDTTDDKLIGWYDLGSSVTLLENQTLLIDFTDGNLLTLT
jgi:hypothetical protein